MEDNKLTEELYKLINASNRFQKASGPTKLKLVNLLKKAYKLGQKNPENWRKNNDDPGFGMFGGDSNTKQ